MTDFLKSLVDTIKIRKDEKSNKSYTYSLLKEGPDKCIDKLEEEFYEFKKSIKEKKNIVHEGADLMYHFIVALESANTNFDDILDELEKRKVQSGFDEKKSRK